MTTWKELVYIALDSLKIHSDDSKFTEDHVIFLLSKYRAFVLNQTYAKAGKSISDSNYQTINMDLIKSSIIDKEVCGNSIYLRSNTTIPNILHIGNPKVYPIDYFKGEITFIPKERMKYVGNNRFLQNIIYCSYGTNNYLYLKSSNPQFKYLEKAEFYAIFENPIEVYNLEDSKINILDRVFPVEDNLIPAILEYVMKDLTNGIYKPSDNTNDAQDALSDLAGYLRRNMKSQFQKQIDE